MARNRYGVSDSRRARPGRLMAYDAALWAAIMSPLLVFVTGDILWHYPEILSGKEIPEAVQGTKAAPNYVRNFLELSSFVATTAVIITALFALVLTLSQVSEARDARIAAIYVEINKNYNSPYLVDARRAVRRLHDSYKRDITDDTPFGKYVAGKFTEWSEFAMDTPEYGAYSESMRLMQFWEDVGVLIQRTLVDIDVVLELHAGAVLYASTVFGTYVAAARQGQDPPTLYANALWLMSQARDFRPFAFVDAN